MSTNVVDLVSSPVGQQSTPTAATGSGGGEGSHRKRSRNRGFATRRSPRNRNHAGEGNYGGAPEVLEVIDSEDEVAVTAVSTVTSASTMNNSHRSRRRRRRHQQYLDDDVVEVLNVLPSHATAASTAAAAATSTAKMSSSPPLDKSTIIKRVREIFPLVNRDNMERIWNMTTRYLSNDTHDGEDILELITTVLSDDHTGNNITETSIAAAMVGGRVDPESAAAAVASSSSFPLQGNNATSAGTGIAKVAQLECQCCFGDFDFDEMVSCKGEGHLFCKMCLQKHTEQRVFGLGNFGVKPTANAGAGGNRAASTSSASTAFEILCMHSSGCSSGFHEGQLRKALSEKVMKKYDELQYMSVVEKADMKDVCKCPKCQYLACADESMIVFHCPQCNYKSCRACGEEAHPGIRCDQVETKHETDGRKVVEEAMTNAKLRTCPKPTCRKKFMKSDGCNKMTCACGIWVCYICRKEIPKNVGYGHFCQTPHCGHESCKKCPLYTNGEEDDKRAIREAGLQAAKAVNGTGRKKQVNVDVESLLKEPPVKKSPVWGRRR